MKIAMLRKEKAAFGELIRIDGIAAGLRGQGHVVDVFTLERRAGMRAALSPSFLLFCAAKFRQLCRYVGFPASRPFATVVFGGILAAYHLIPRLQRGNYEILLAETHQAGLCAWFMRPHLGAKLYIDFHGTADEFVAHPALLEQGLILERFLLQQCDLAICCSGVMRQHFLTQHHGDPTRIIVCHNGAELHQRVAEYRLPLRVIYAGVFAYYQRVMDFVEAARLNTDPEIEFCLMGGGGNEKEILDYVAKQGIRMTWLGYRPRQETLDVFATMQVGVLPTTDDIARQVASPIKILDYASCGLPVVTVAVGEWSEVFRDYQAGIVCSSCNAESLLAAIRALKERERWIAGSRNARRLIREARAWPVVLAPLFEHLRSLAVAASAA